MTISFFLRALAAGAFLLLAAPMSNAAVNPPSSPGSEVATAKALIEEGKFNEALILLQPLVRDRNAEEERAVPHRFGSDRCIAAARRFRTMSGIRC